ncbi:QueT transporter family protein [Agrilactobacillus fermenti]|uniref:QueT transporter family protein n=1 Tax=Agrilactobacillus fermenti TaxID=2586909 RepID=UPI001E2BF085|nr:QueT transporter family protein [Agrilactobacillus fermenti]MCD2257146.1 QueT transporter family protein [Agrilactobacillus fermenti]
MEKVSTKTAEVTKIALVAALYVAVTMVIVPFGYGAIQLRLSEGFNHLVAFNKRYIIALTIGCALANLVSPLGIVDIVFGTLGTLVMTTISYFLTKRVKSVPVKLTITTVVCTLMTWSVALELNIVTKVPFWPTYGTVALGELLSMALGAILVYLLQKRIDFTK